MRTKRVLSSHLFRTACASHNVHKSRCSCLAAASGSIVVPRYPLEKKTPPQYVNSMLVRNLLAPCLGRARAAVLALIVKEWWLTRDPVSHQEHLILAEICCQ